MNNPPRKDYKVTNTRHAPAADTAAVATLSGAAGKVLVVDQIVWSYSIKNAAAETLTVESPSGTTIFGIDIPIPAADTIPAPQNIPFHAGLDGALGEDVIVTLSASSGTNLGKVNVLYH